MKVYKVHVSYIDNNGVIIKDGTYNENEIDLAVARNKSIVTLVDATVNIKTQKPKQELELVNFNSDISVLNSVSEVKINSENSTIKIIKIKINSIDIEELKNLKYIGKATAEKVIKYRENNKIKSYAQLDDIAPLKSKSWEDITVIDFEDDGVPITLENSVIINETN
jgi:DNA uptake protein ComE-like DNA-binding protein